MIDPSLTWLHALFQIFSRLPSPYLSLVAISATLSGLIIFIRIVRGL